MKRLPKWLSSESWLPWKEKLHEIPQDPNDFGYGLKLE
jgi:hypothetical protein